MKTVKEHNTKKHPVWGHVINVLLFFVTFFTSLLAFSARWAFTNWSQLTMDEILFELKAPIAGTGNGMIADYVKRAVVPAAFLAILFAMLLLCGRKFLSKKIIHRIFGLGSLALLVVTLLYCEENVKLSKWIRGKMEKSTLIETNYVNPDEVKITFPQQKRNLIYIFLESMEIAYTDPGSGGVFPENIIPELTRLSMENENFSGESGLLNGGVAAAGTTWTMGAMFAQTSGLPLIMDIGENDMNTQASFFPDIMTLGDILQEEGYHQVLLLGSRAVFGGRKLYYTEHGNFDMEDYTYAKEHGKIPEDYHVWWGYEDEKLFAFARERLTELAGEGKPFHLTLLTVDTHFEDGYVCRLCGEEFGKNQYANVMACSSRQTAAFVEWIQEQDFYDNTTIVLIGDHPTMDVDFCKEVPDTYERKVYTTLINSAVSPKDPARCRYYTTFDLFPTTLAAMGADIDGEHLGLGVNLFSSENTLAEEYGMEEVNEELSKRSVFLEKLEAVDAMSEKLLKHYRSEMKHSLDVSAYSPENKVLSVYLNDIPDIAGNIGKIEAKIINQQTGEEIDVRLENKPDASWQAGVDMTEWEGDTVTISISIVNRKAVRYEDLVTRQIRLE